MNGRQYAILSNKENIKNEARTKNMAISYWSLLQFTIFERSAI